MSIPKSNKSHDCDLIEELIQKHGLDFIIDTGALALNHKAFYRLIDYIMDDIPLIQKGEKYQKKVVAKHYGIDIYRKISFTSIVIRKHIKQSKS